MTRRTLLRQLGAAAFAAWLPSPALAQGDTVQQFASLRQRWRQARTGQGAFDPHVAPFDAMLSALDAEAAHWLAQLDLRPVSSAMFSDRDAGGSPIKNARITLERLRVIAVAWSTPGSIHAGDAGTLATISAALSRLQAQCYHPRHAVSICWRRWALSKRLLAHSRCPPHGRHHG